MCAALNIPLYPIIFILALVLIDLVMQLSFSNYCNGKIQGGCLGTPGYHFLQCLGEQFHCGPTLFGATFGHVIPSGLQEFELFGVSIIEQNLIFIIHLQVDG